MVDGWGVSKYTCVEAEGHLGLFSPFMRVPGMNSDLLGFLASAFNPLNHLSSHNFKIYNDHYVMRTISMGFI